MSARVSHLLAACGCLALATLAACKSDSTGPGDNTKPIPNPSGPRALGDLVSLNVNGIDACIAPIYHTARVVAVGSKSIILSDTLNPKNGFSTADYQRFAARFDTLVYPLDVANFGDPLDIDESGKIAILFTRAVNELTPPRAAQYVGGFFFSRDLFPNQGTPRAQACAGSNQGEYFYMLAPDPNGTVNGNIRTNTFVDSATTAVLAHEFQHLINASRRLYVNNSPIFEDKWLDEGLAHIAEELLFYRESGLSPRSNLALGAVRATAPVSNAFTADMGGNQSRYRSYLLAPSSNSPYSLDDSLPTRGAAWSLLRYVVDRANATDGFTAGNGQATTTPGDVALTPGGAAGEYAITLVNTSLQPGSSTAFALKSTPAAGTASLPADEVLVPSMMRAATMGTPDAPRIDEQFESRLRARERAELTPRMAAARRWYASQSTPAPGALRSRSSLASSSFAGADGAVWFKLVNNTTAGIANLQSVVGNDLAGYLRDWSVSHAVDDVAALTTQYQQRSWNWHSIFTAKGPVGNQAYPLLVTTLSTSTSVNGTIVAGGASFYTLTVPANGTVTLTLSAPGGAVNPNLQLVAVRTK